MAAFDLLPEAQGPVQCLRFLIHMNTLVGVLAQLPGVLFEKVCRAKALEREEAHIQLQPDYGHEMATPRRSMFPWKIYKGKGNPLSSPR